MTELTSLCFGLLFCQNGIFLFKVLELLSLISSV